MTDRKLMQQALEALETLTVDAKTTPNAYEAQRQAITALRAAIEQAHDWDEVEALRASLREHMAEIQRLRAALEQAQPELEQAMTDAIIGGTGVMLGDRRIDPASIYKQPEQEPVAWVYPEGLEAFKSGKPWTAYGSSGEGRIPLYLAPRQWQGLTDNEIVLICGECAASAHQTDDLSYARAIEARLREKNS
jgi:hypothetical protein